MAPHHALLIEDEIAARADLRAKLAAHPEVQIVGEAATVRQARERLAGADYDLVFLDVQLIGGDGFSLVPDVRPQARIIFTTAYDTFAVRAFEVNALDYLLKPIVATRLAKALRRWAEPAPEQNGRDSAAPVGGVLQLSDTVYLRDGLRARFVPVAQIAVIVAQDNYCHVQLADGSSVLMRKSLKAWEDTLPDDPFMRVHRTQIVNLTLVQRYERDRAEHTRLHVAGVAEPVAVSRDRWPELQQRLIRLRPQP
jgi:two-component system LytT family response regulator